MIERARKAAEIFKEYGVAYLFIGKFGAILYGYPGTTQDIDISPLKEKSNCEKLVNALKDLGFHLDATLKEAILKGKDFIQIRGGPFPIDIIFDPDGIESFKNAKKPGNYMIPDINDQLYYLLKGEFHESFFNYVFTD
ncbi:hypothetical protein MYX76_01605 [Desulfobacterota bacterium AH_259_B03_O07]|nr:hypothetical protein [Desulfobacterota bacterium AH_259_B03_O07]